MHGQRTGQWSETSAVQCSVTSTQHMQKVYRRLQLIQSCYRYYSGRVCRHLRIAAYTERSGCEVRTGGEEDGRDGIAHIIISKKFEVGESGRTDGCPGGLVRLLYRHLQLRELPLETQWHRDREAK